ncbi:hypothetical protein AgCh_034334 [Apium graveolens]
MRYLQLYINFSPLVLSVLADLQLQQRAWLAYVYGNSNSLISIMDLSLWRFFSFGGLDIIEVVEDLEPAQVIPSKIGDQTIIRFRITDGRVAVWGKHIKSLDPLFNDVLESPIIVILASMRPLWLHGKAVIGTIESLRIYINLHNADVINMIKRVQLELEQRISVQLGFKLSSDFKLEFDFEVGLRVEHPQELINSIQGKVDFDHSGSYLAIGGLDIRVYQVANVKFEWNCLKILPDLSGTGSS